jgi:cytochrome c nitrite reductase small subunit
VHQFGLIPDAIRARDVSRRVINDNCIEGHHDTVEDIVDWPTPMGRYCFDCHRTAGHGERGISTAPRQQLEACYLGNTPTPGRPW